MPTYPIVRIRVRPLTAAWRKSWKTVFLGSLESIHNATAETVGCPFENMANYSEDFTVATWVQERWLLLVTSNVGHV